MLGEIDKTDRTIPIVIKDSSRPMFLSSWLRLLKDQREVTFALVFQRGFRICHLSYKSPTRFRGKPVAVQLRQKNAPLNFC
jgi:hypothetical protein